MSGCNATFMGYTSKLGGTMSSTPIPKENARPLRIGRVVLAVAFFGSMGAAALQIKAGVVACFAIAALSAVVSYAWRCPVCRKTFALRLGWFGGIAIPYTDESLLCGSRLQ